MNLSHVLKTALICLCCSHSLYDKPLIAEEKPPLILEGAEYVRQRLEDGKTTVILEGDVRWAKGESRLRCGRAKYIEEDGLLFLSKDVHLVDKNRDIQADSVKYIHAAEYAIAIGNVILKMEGGEVTVWSDSIDYSFGAEEAWAFKRPRMVLRQSGSDGEEARGVTILGDRLHAREDNFITVTGDVYIIGDSLSGRSDSLHYDVNLEKIFLLGSPWIEVSSYRLDGRTIDLFVPGRVLRQGISRGSARGEQREPIDDSDDGTEEDTIVSWIEADTIALTFLDERIDSLIAWPDARSLYSLYREGDLEENYATGDEIRLAWKGGKLDLIRVSGRGEGVYLKKREESE